MNFHVDDIDIVNISIYGGKEGVGVNPYHDIDFQKILKLNQ